MIWEDEVAHGIMEITKKRKGQMEDLKVGIRKLASFQEEINTDKIIFFEMLTYLDSQSSINKQFPHSTEFH